MSQNNKRQPFSILQKVLMCVAALGVIGVAGFAYAAFYYFTEVSPVDPASSDRMEHQVLMIDKLPSGFDRVLVTKFSGITIVNYKNYAENIDVKVLKGPAWARRRNSPEEVVEMKSRVGKTIESGTKLVAGERMYYEIRNVPWLKTNQFVGAVIVGETGEDVQFEIISAYSPNFKMSQADAFLASVKGFNGKTDPAAKFDPAPLKRPKAIEKFEQAAQSKQTELHKIRNEGNFVDFPIYTLCKSQSAYFVDVNNVQRNSYWYDITMVLDAQTAPPASTKLSRENRIAWLHQYYTKYVPKHTDWKVENDNFDQETLLRMRFSRKDETAYLSVEPPDDSDEVKVKVKLKHQEQATLAK